MTLQLLDTGARSAKENMVLDTELLHNLRQSSAPTLHIYHWNKPSITYGHFVEPNDLLDMEAVRELGIETARRPTGGGVTFHFGDLAFSVLIPAHHPRFSCCTLDNYAFINHAVAEAIRACIHTAVPELLAHPLPEHNGPCRHFCMAHPTKYDVILDGKKVGGAAQRRTKHGFLHQGTICLSQPDATLLKRILKNYDTVAPAMLAHSLPLELDSKILTERLYWALS